MTTRTVGDYQAMPLPKSLWGLYYLTRPFPLAGHVAKNSPFDSPFAATRPARPDLRPSEASRPGGPGSGEAPRLFGVVPPRPRLVAVGSVDMNAANSCSWAEFAGRSREAHLEDEGPRRSSNASTHFSWIVSRDSRYG
jgi:hypothetical protein